MLGGQEQCCAVSLFYNPQHTQLYMKNSFVMARRKYFFFLRWSLNGGVVRSRASSDVFLPLPPSLCADLSSSNVLRLCPCSPGPGLDLPCPPLTVPLLSCYSYRNNSQLLTAIHHVAKPEYGSAFVLAGQLKRSLWSH